MCQQVVFRYKFNISPQALGTEAEKVLKLSSLFPFNPRNSLVCLYIKDHRKNLGDYAYNLANLNKKKPYRYIRLQIRFLL